MTDFRDKPGPKVPIIEKRHLSSGGRNGGQKAAKRARVFAKVKSKPLEWGSK